MRLFALATFAMIGACAVGDVTRNTEWQDVPDTTKVGTVLDLGSTAAITASMATNIAGRVTSNVVTKAYVEGLGISGGGGADTNAVNDLIREYVTTNAVTTNLMARVGDTATNVVSEILFIYDESFTQKKRDYSDMTASTNWNFKGWNEEGFYDPLYVVATNGIYGSTKWQLWSVIDGQATKLSEVDHRDKNDLEIIFSNVGPSRLDVIARRCSYEEDDTLATVKTIIQGTITPTAATNAAQIVIDKNIETNNLCTVAAAQAMTNGFYKLPQGGIGRSDLDNGVNTSLNNADNALDASLAFSTFAQKATTLAGYGIADAFTKEELNTKFSDGSLDLIVKSVESVNLIRAMGGLFLAGTADVGQWSNVFAEYQTLPEYLSDKISSSSVTNGGAKSYADYVGAATLASATNSAKSYSDATFATSNMVERISTNVVKSALSGRTYDFANGSNFTKRVYTALTNVIQTLGGSVTNAPNFTP